MGGKKSFCISCEDVLKCFHFISPDGSIEIRNEGGRIYFTVAQQITGTSPELTATTEDLIINTSISPGTTLITLPQAFKAGSCKLFINGVRQQPEDYIEQPPKKIQFLTTSLKPDEEVTIDYLPA